MRNTLEALPPWLIMLIGLAMVVLLGIVDYLTGDYSLLIFYAIPVALVAWCAGRWGATLIGVVSGIARLVSDYFSYNGPHFKYWNSLQDMVFLLMVGLLIAVLKELMEPPARDED